MVPAAVGDRAGKSADGRARTREVKLACLFTQTGLDEQGRPVRDPDSTSYLGSVAPAAELATLVHAEARRRGADHIRQLVVLGDGAPCDEMAGPWPPRSCSKPPRLWTSTTPANTCTPSPPGWPPSSARSTPTGWPPGWPTSTPATSKPSSRNHPASTRRRHRPRPEGTGLFQKRRPCMRYETTSTVVNKGLHTGVSDYRSAVNDARLAVSDLSALAR